MPKTLLIFAIILAAAIQAYTQEEEEKEKEFPLKRIIAKHNGYNEEVHQEIFEQYDKNGNGLVSKREFRRAMKAINRDQENPDETLTNKKLNKLFEDYDINEDNKIDVDEAKVALNKPRKRCYWPEYWNSAHKHQTAKSIYFLFGLSFLLKYVL